MVLLSSDTAINLTLNCTDLEIPSPEPVQISFLDKTLVNIIMLEEEKKSNNTNMYIQFN